MGTGDESLLPSRALLSAAFGDMSLEEALGDADSSWEWLQGGTPEEDRGTVAPAGGIEHLPASMQRAGGAALDSVEQNQTTPISAHPNAHPPGVASDRWNTATQTVVIPITDGQLDKPVMLGGAGIDCGWDTDGYTLQMPTRQTSVSEGGVGYDAPWDDRELHSSSAFTAIAPAYVDEVAFDSHPALDLGVDHDLSIALDVDLDLALDLDLETVLVAPPLALLDRTLREAGIGDGDDAREVLAQVPPDLLTPTVLRRCLPGLGDCWDRLGPLVADVLRQAGLPLRVAPTVDAASWIAIPDTSPPISDSTSLDSLSLFQAEVWRWPLLSPEVHMALGRWIAEGEVLADVAGRSPMLDVTPDSAFAHLLDYLQEHWDTVAALVPERPATGAGWRGALTAIAFGTVTDDQLAALAAVTADPVQIRATIRRIQAILRVLPATLLAEVAEVVTFTGALSTHGHTGATYDAPPLTVIQHRARAARRVMVRHNLRLVYSIALHYINATPRMDLVDLVQEGAFGLMRAAERWDPARGYTFSTYATWWIRQSITRAIADQGLAIRLPVHAQEAAHPALARVTLARESRGDERWLHADEAEALAALITSRSAVNEVRDLVQELAHTPDAGLPERTAHDVARAMTVASLDGAAWREAALVADDSDDGDLEAAGDAASLRTVLAESLRSLTERERRVLQLRFGLLDGRQRTLEEVGRGFGVTRERIRQIEAKALRKMRHPSRSRRLRGYATDEDIDRARRLVEEGLTPKGRKRLATEAKVAALGLEIAEFAVAAGAVVVPEQVVVAPRRGRPPKARPETVAAAMSPSATSMDGRTRFRVLDRLHGLSPLQERVMRYRLGLVDGTHWPVDAIARALIMPLTTVEAADRAARHSFADLIVEGRDGLLSLR